MALPRRARHEGGRNRLVVVVFGVFLFPAQIQRLQDRRIGVGVQHRLLVRRVLVVGPAGHHERVLVLPVDAECRPRSNSPCPRSRGTPCCPCACAPACAARATGPARSTACGHRRPARVRVHVLQDHPVVRTPLSLLCDPSQRPVGLFVLVVGRRRARAVVALTRASDSPRSSATTTPPTPTSTSSTAAVDSARPISGRASPRYSLGFGSTTVVSPKNSGSPRSTRMNSSWVRSRSILL